MGIMDTVLPRSTTQYDHQRLKFKNQNSDRDVSVLEQLGRSRLKIAVVTETWPPELNGVSLSLLQICKGLQKLGHKILLVRPSQKQICSEFSPNRECLVNGQTIPKYAHMQFGWPQYGKVAKAFDEFQPDLVHIVTEGPLGLAVLQLSKNKKIPVSSGFHSAFHDFSRFYDLAFMVKPIQHYLKWFHNNTQLTCVPSQDSADAIRSFGVTCQVEVIKTGVDVEKFSPTFRSVQLRRQWDACENTTVLLYVGRVSPEKEIQVLIDAYLKLKTQTTRRFKLVIVGDGPDYSRLVRQSKHTDIIFTGSLSGTNLAESFASADVFVFASQVETFGNVVLEAMASALPVVAYDYACAKQYLDAETAWLAPLGEPATLVQYIVNLPQNKRLHAMGMQAMKKVQQVGWQHPAQQLEHAFYRVVQQKTLTA